VAVYSRSTPAPACADGGRSRFIGPSRSDQSYLVKEKILEARLPAGARLSTPATASSENPAFAEMVANAGLVFVDLRPPP